MLVTQQKHFLNIIKSHSFSNLTSEITLKKKKIKKKNQRKKKPGYLLPYVSTLVVCAKHKLVQIRNPESSANRSHFFWSFTKATQVRSPLPLRFTTSRLEYTSFYPALLNY